ncbi:MAG: hypothetical protein HY866_04100 [Chloroflexi bacterium]|nr:hypothetical protein [Chloroflexota bacterium]
MPWLVCPHCGDQIYAELVSAERPSSHRVGIGDLPAPAFAILTSAPETFRNGGVLPVRAWLGLTPYKSVASVYVGLRALEKAGFVRAVAYGQRKQYAGTPKLKDFSVA